VPKTGKLFVKIRTAVCLVIRHAAANCLWPSAAG